MTCDQLLKILEDENFDASVIAIGRNDVEDRLCVHTERGKWTVYFSERGSRLNRRYFDEESEACVFALDTLRRYAETHPHIMKKHG